MGLSFVYECPNADCGSQFVGEMDGDSVYDLLAHTSKLEAMLRKHEWADKNFGMESDESVYTISKCPECEMERLNGHSPDCELARLIE